MIVSRKPALGFIFITLFLDVLGIGLIIPILPKLVEHLQGDNISAASHTVGFLASLYALMQFLCAPILGSLSDRFGRRPVILSSLLGSGIDYLVLAFAPNLGWFFLGRAVAGITGANITAATAYIADITPPEKRAANFGMIGAAFGLGFITGPAIGGFLGSENLRLPFLVAAGLALTNWLYGFFILPESLSEKNRRPFSWRRANPVGSLSSLRRYPFVLNLALSLFIMNIAQMMLQGTWALYTAYRYDWSPRQIGWSLTFVGIMAAIVQGGLARRVIPRLGEGRSMIIGLGMSSVAFACYASATRGWMLFPALVIGCSGGITGPAGQGLISRNVGDNEQGAVHGAVTSLNSLAGIIGPLISTNLFGWMISPGAPIHLPGVSFYAASGMMLCALVSTVRCLRTHAIRMVKPPSMVNVSPVK